MSSRNRHTRKSVQRPVTANIVAQATPPSATSTCGPSKGSRMGQKRLKHHQKDSYRPRSLCQATIDKLPDDVLLEIFDFYLDYKGPSQDFDKWHTLVHVCRRWRNVVFASPRRLDLRLLCRRSRPVRTMLDIWPALPISIEDVWADGWAARLDNVFAAFEHPDRVRSISLTHVAGTQKEPLAAAMQLRFPELTELRFRSFGVYGPVLPDPFLGGSAPRLQTLWLTNVPFLAAPMLLSASNLVDLRLDRIPHSGYIPPASIVACLSRLNKLESLSLGFEFEFSQTRPDQPSPPPQSRVVLPALIKLNFEGRSEYLDHLVACIDTPVLNVLNMTAFRSPVFHLRHLTQFIDRAKGLKPPKAAELKFPSWTIHLDSQRPHSLSLGLGVKYYYERESITRQVSTFALLCGQVSHLFSLVERLDLQAASRPRKGARASTEFLEIFRLFPATRSLYVHKDLVPLIAPALQELIGARATEVLPNLRDLFLGRTVTSGSVREAIRPFVDARRLSGRPIAVQFLGERGTVVRWFVGAVCFTSQLRSHCGRSRMFLA